MLSEAVTRKEIRSANDGQSRCTSLSTPKPRLPELGITRNESSDWQRLAKVPERVLEKVITIVKERDGVLTEAAVKREIIPSKAYQEREARIAERKKQQGNNIIPPPPITIKLKKEIALKIANAGYRELMKKAHLGTENLGIKRT